jgi:type I restriction enzyme R subunit
MRPVVADPAIALEQLFTELAASDNDAQRQVILSQLVVLLRRRLKRLPPAVKEQYAAVAGETVEETLARLRRSRPVDTAAWVKAHPGLGGILDANPDNGGVRLPISHHPDAVVAVNRGYGPAQRPDDFLDSFTAYVRANINTIAALTVVAQRPRELTRAQLRELQLALDRLGYSDANLRRAWRDAHNEDIAASIIGFVRQAALGDPLIPYAERVRRAIRRILASRHWTEPQRQWLQRIGLQLEHALVAERDLLENEHFKAHGGFRRLNKIFDGRLEAILGDINEELWRTTG